jgi:hypothetical protein
MADDNTARDVDRVWDLMKKIGFVMLVTRDGDKLRARPMSAAATGTRPDIGDNRKVAM